MMHGQKNIKPDYCLVGHGSSLHGGKAAGACSWPLTSIYYQVQECASRAHTSTLLRVYAFEAWSL